MPARLQRRAATRNALRDICGVAASLARARCDGSVSCRSGKNCENASRPFLWGPRLSCFTKGRGTNRLSAKFESFRHQKQCTNTS